MTPGHFIDAACSLSKNRFHKFLGYVTFDNQNTKRLRQTDDKMSAIHEVWEELLQKNIKNIDSIRVENCRPTAVPLEDMFVDVLT